jgi:hypothetical protein
MRNAPSRKSAKMADVLTAPLLVRAMPIVQQVKSVRAVNV